MDGWFQWLEFLPDNAFARGGAGFTVLVVLAYLAYRIVLSAALRVVRKVVERTDTTWDDSLLQRRVFHRLARVVPFAIVQMGASSVLPEQPAEWVRRIAVAATAVILVRTISAFLAAVNDIYEKYPVSEGRPIKGYLQVVTILSYIMGGTFVIAALVDRSPWGLLSGIGAISAVLLLIFKDTILSLVASIQLSSYDLLREGDWISMPQFGADGDVIDVSLHTVRVQNWDKTVVGIPTHKFLDHAFTNWRGMSESGGRRIKRNLRLDLTTVRFLTDDELAKWSEVALLADYLAEKRRALQASNAGKSGAPVNLRRLTNIGTFRAYIEAYLRANDRLHPDFTFLVRQLPPDAQGLPIEIYVFTATTAWGEYEAIQADIFDHLLAVVQEFGLRVFQEPSGADFAALARDPRA
jgi:miniconductance mechanosensitive channel